MAQRQVRSRPQPPTYNTQRSNKNTAKTHLAGRGNGLFVAREDLVDVTLPPLPPLFVVVGVRTKAPVLVKALAEKATDTATTRVDRTFLAVMINQGSSEGGEDVSARSVFAVAVVVAVVVDATLVVACRLLPNKGYYYHAFWLWLFASTVQTREASK